MEIPDPAFGAICPDKDRDILGVWGILVFLLTDIR